MYFGSYSFSNVILNNSMEYHRARSIQTSFLGAVHVSLVTKPNYI
jgi:hypothetical protein